ncbi:MAG TPA: hypothetical protein VGP26_06380 [Actinophytocola sp.]|nr:hypothetical protein [Actinophytocola sp.]
MRKKIVTGIAATALAAGAAIAVTNSASADDGWLCMTRDATPVYASVSNGNYDGYLFTLSAGRGFRAEYEEGGSGDVPTWSAYYGHGAEHPERDGFVKSDHLAC